MNTLPRGTRIAVPIIAPYDGFARDIFGVLHMESILENAEEQGVTFFEMRNAAYTHGIDERQRIEFRALAKFLSSSISLT